MLTSIYHPLPYATNPATYFAALAQLEGAILLDSGAPIAQGRYDICSALPVAQIQPETGELGSAFLARAQRLLKQQAPASNWHDLPFSGGLLGFFNYEFRADSPCQSPQVARIGLYEWAVISDHKQQKTWLMVHPHYQGSIDQLFQLLAITERQTTTAFNLLSPFTADITQAEYNQKLSAIQNYILAGDCYQVNFTQRFSASYTGDPWQAYCQLRQSCPTPFAGFVRLAENEAIISLSPERFISCQQRQVETKPIKGTRPRAFDYLEDQALANELAFSEKDRAENLMIVDLMRNDIAKDCVIGSVKVPRLFAIESYPNVHHLVSTITGQLKPTSSVFDLFGNCFPGGSITGAPKIRAMQIIAELEQGERGIYCGSLFYLDNQNRFDSSICIRTLRAQNGIIECFGGGGIVLDSDIKDEYQESLDKISILMRTLER